MSKHRKRHKKHYDEFEFESLIYTSRDELILNPNKFVLIKENTGIYCIYNISRNSKVMIKKFVDDDDEYALNCASEVLDYLIKDI